MLLIHSHEPIQRGGPHLKNHKNIGFLCNTGLDPLENHKATKPAFNMLNHHWHASKMPFKWHFAGRPMMAPLLWYLDSPSPHQLKKLIKQLSPL